MDVALSVHSAIGSVTASDMVIFDFSTGFAGSQYAAEVQRPIVEVNIFHAFDPSVCFPRERATNSPVYALDS